MRCLFMKLRNKQSSFTEMKLFLHSKIIVYNFSHHLFKSTTKDFFTIHRLLFLSVNSCNIVANELLRYAISRNENWNTSTGDGASQTTFSCFHVLRRFAVRALRGPPVSLTHTDIWSFDYGIKVLLFVNIGIVSSFIWGWNTLFCLL